jgi:monoamine oxidase
VITDAGEIPFDRLVVTLPLGVLQSGTPAFDPPLPAAMSAAVRTLGTGALDVLALRFDEPFWPRDATRLDFVGLTPGEWTSWISLLPARGAPILVATNAALVARRFDAIDDAALTASALAVLRTMRS